MHDYRPIYNFSDGKILDSWNFALCIWKHCGYLNRDLDETFRHPGDFLRLRSGQASPGLHVEPLWGSFDAVIPEPGDSPRAMMVQFLPKKTSDYPILHPAGVAHHSPASIAGVSRTIQPPLPERLEFFYSFPLIPKLIC